MKRREFLQTAAAGAAAAAFPGWARSRPGPIGEGRPNVLVIMADDISPGHFGCYGGPAGTPNLDGLARSGVCFRTGWATPMCAPTRAMLATGRYAHRTGVYHNGLNIPQGAAGRFAQDHLTFARVLRENGYVTALAGKRQALGGPVASAEVGFDEACFHETYGRLPGGRPFEGQWESEEVLPGYPGPVASRYWHPCILQNGREVPTGPETFGEDVFVEFLVDFIRRRGDRPFLAYYPMNLPHGTARGRLPTTPLTGRPGRNEGGNLAECTAYIDALIGRLIRALGEMEILGHTLVLFTSDNGDAGAGKTEATERGARVPLIAGGAGWIRSRGEVGELASLADVFPTLADLAGARLPEGYATDGVSLAPYLRGSSDSTRDRVYSYIGTARMIRDSRWLLEAVDPLGGHPQGRFTDCGDERDPARYPVRTGDLAPEEEAARRGLLEALAAIPHIDPGDPDAARALERYRGHPYPHRLGPRRGG